MKQHFLIWRMSINGLKSALYYLSLPRILLVFICDPRDCVLYKSERLRKFICSVFVSPLNVFVNANAQEHSFFIPTFLHLPCRLLLPYYTLTSTCSSFCCAFNSQRPAGPSRAAPMRGAKSHGRGVNSRRTRSRPTSDSLLWAESMANAINCRAVQPWEQMARLCAPSSSMFK